MNDDFIPYLQSRDGRDNDTSTIHYYHDVKGPVVWYGYLDGDLSQTWITEKYVSVSEKERILKTRILNDTWVVNLRSSENEGAHQVVSRLFDKKTETI